MRENTKHKRSGGWLWIGTILAAAVFVFWGNSTSLTDEFIHYCQETQKENVYVMPSGTRWHILKVWREESGSAGRLMLRLESETEENTYRWLKSSEEQKREDLVGVEEISHRFAEKRNMAGIYSIYVELWLTDTKTQAFYDEVSGWMWLPAQMETYLEMYETFGTFSCPQIMRKEGGEEFLRERQMVQMKNGMLCEKKEAEYQIVTGD